MWKPAGKKKSLLTKVLQTNKFSSIPNNFCYCYMEVYFTVQMAFPLVQWDWMLSVTQHKPQGLKDVLIV